MFYVIVGIVMVLWLLAKIGNVYVDVKSDLNRATQDQRDKAILNELRKMNDKE